MTEVFCLKITAAEIFQSNALRSQLDRLQARMHNNKAVVALAAKIALATTVNG